MVPRVRLRAANGERGPWLRRAAVIVAAAVLAMSALVTFGEHRMSLKSLLSRIFNAASNEWAGRVERDRAYGPRADQRLDVYAADRDDPARPIVVFIHGGGWRSGDKELYGFVGTALAARGFTTVIPNYRKYPDVRYPAFVEDAARAYGWAADNLSGRCGRARPIVLAGHSAGAHIAALVALDTRHLDALSERPQGPAGLVGLAGPYAFDPTESPDTKDIFKTATEKDHARPVAFVGRSAPPALLLHGADDSVVRVWNTEELAKALRQANVAATMAIYPGIGHIGLVTAIGRPLRFRAPVLDAVTSFLNGLPKPRACATEHAADEPPTP